MDMAGVTREEAVLYLMSLQNQIDLIVQTRKHDYESILNTQKGDLFYIKLVIIRQKIFLHQQQFENKGWTYLFILSQYIFNV